jgi:V-type H+-transporting ATPase proteolipid subunit
MKVFLDWVGLTGLGQIKLTISNFETGINEKLGIRASAQQDKIFIGMILILIFAEALGLYGFIVGIIIANS